MVERDTLEEAVYSLLMSVHFKSYQNQHNVIIIICDLNIKLNCLTIQLLCRANVANKVGVKVMLIPLVFVENLDLILRIQKHNAEK